MGTSTCCRYHAVSGPVPEEPPRGTWVKDRFGRVHLRLRDGWTAGREFHTFARWEPMWEARGPLVECEPWGWVKSD